MERAKRDAPLEMTPDEFRRLGHRAVDRMAEFLEGLPRGPVTHEETPEQVRAAIGSGELPEEGTDPGTLIDEVGKLLPAHSLFNGHPKFLGYITSSAAPIGSIADFMAATINPNLGGWLLSPIGSEIELQTIRWISEFMGYPSDCGGILVSGGNMANFVGFLAARHARAPWKLREQGFTGRGSKPLAVYVSTETHTWIQKAADLFGLGTENIRWIPVDEGQRMRTDALRDQIARDRRHGVHPFLVVGTAGSVSTGAVDPLREIARISREEDLWFHVDGAYGAIAANLPGADPDLAALSEADSVAVDPHKWLYAPLEAGCVLVRHAPILRETFEYRPPYYKLLEPEEEDEEEPTSFYALGPQNSRGFRALKVWMAFRQVGRRGFERMLLDDMEVARALFDAAQAHPELEAKTCALSIATYRYVPEGIDATDKSSSEYLDRLNEEILTRMQAEGEAFVSVAIIDGAYYLRGCVVNFRTTKKNVEEIAEITVRLGRELDATLRPAKHETS